MTDLGPTTRELPALQDAVLAVVGTGDLGDGLGARDESTEETMSTGARIFGGEPMVIVDGAVGGDPPGRRRRQAEEPAVVETAESPPRGRRRRRAAGARVAGESPSKGTRSGASGGSSKHERFNMRNARARDAKCKAAVRARRAPAAGLVPPAPPAPARASFWTDEQMASLGRGHCTIKSSLHKIHSCAA